MLKQNNAEIWAKKWPSPAKLNLMLRIIGQRSDGYHLLQTVFQFVDFCDWIIFHPVMDGKVTLQKLIPGVLESEDLTIKAAKLLKEETGCENGVCIEVEKNLPMGGGLGGGSSDAATTLLVLNELWGLHLSLEKLMELGLSLGADVPVFVFGYASWAEGVGEKLKKIIIPEQWVVLVKPDCHVNTKEIFSAEDLTRDSISITIKDFISGQHNNDCTDVVCSRYPLIQQAMLEMSDYCEARLTGTGACIFGVFSSKEEAGRCYNELRKKWKVFIVKSINESPLVSMLRVGKS